MRTPRDILIPCSAAFLYSAIQVSRACVPARARAPRALACLRRIISGVCKRPRAMRRLCTCPCVCLCTGRQERCQPCTTRTTLPRSTQSMYDDVNSATCIGTRTDVCVGTRARICALPFVRSCARTCAHTRAYRGDRALVTGLLADAHGRARARICV